MTLGKTIGQICGLAGLLATAVSLGFPVGGVAAQQVAARVMTAGAGLYAEHCAPCHQATGQGDGAAPPLAANSRLRDQRLVIGQILRGGEYMQAFGFQLSDAEIAAVATYVRNSWENKHGPISEAQVKALR
jgi:mono/diheme cytochrome c family protein